MGTESARREVSEVGSSLRVGRIGGVPVGVHWTWVFVAALVVWSLASSLFPATYPGLAGSTYLVMALVAGGLLFASILLHELGHTLRALREGMRIREVTLWLFGGVASFEGAFPSAGAEFRVAVAGPAVSAALAGGFWVASQAMQAAGLPAAAHGVADYLARINALLLGFNLVPALPLDGGRALHAWLWRRQRSPLAATLSAATAGKLFAGVLIGIGLLGLFSGGGAGGVWMVFIGWFLLQAAQGEATDAQLRGALGGQRVRDVMTADPVTVDADLPLDTFVDRVAPSARHVAYPVVDGGRLVGLVAAGRAVEVPADQRPVRTVLDVMVRGDEIPVVRADDDALAALPALQQEPGRAVVVADGGATVVGVLAPSDVVRVVDLERRRGEPIPGARRAGAGVWVAVVAAILVAGGALYHPPYVVIEPGPSFDIRDDVSITGVPAERPSGAYLLTSVRLRHPNALGLLVAALRPDREVVSVGSVTPKGMGPGEQADWQQSLFRDSQRLAAAAAADAAGLPVAVNGRGATVVDLVRSSPAAGVLERGDTIVEVDGVAVETAGDLHDLLATRPPGSPFTLTVERDGQRRRVEVRTRRLPQVAGGVGIGVFAETRDLRIDLPFEVRFRTRPDVGGPSAGLAYALAIADMLDPADRARSRSVAATGTVDLDGRVGPVGGVREKAVAARSAGADVFLVPSSEATGVDVPRLDVRSVDDLTEALRVLEAA